MAAGRGSILASDRWFWSTLGCHLKVYRIHVISGDFRLTSLPRALFVVSSFPGRLSAKLRTARTANAPHEVGFIHEE